MEVTMENSILISIKQLLDIDSEESDFDMQAVIFINAAFSKLTQIGVGGKPFRIHDESATWNEICAPDEAIDMIKEFVYLEVKKVFDQPQSGTQMEAIKSIASELEWRINHEVDYANRT